MLVAVRNQNTKFKNNFTNLTLSLVIWFQSKIISNDKLRADFSFSNLRQSVFENCCLNHAIFNQQTKIESCNFNNSELAHVSLRERKISNVNFAGCVNFI